MNARLAFCLVLVALAIGCEPAGPTCIQVTAGTVWVDVAQSIAKRSNGALVVCPVDPVQQPLQVSDGGGAGGASGAGGATSGGAVSCAPETGDDPCTLCLKSSCCAEADECVTAAACDTVVACGTNNCDSACGGT